MSNAPKVWVVKGHWRRLRNKDKLVWIPLHIAVRNRTEGDKDERD